MTGFDTVVLFDVENLLGAPAGWQKAAAKLSFGDILTQLRRDESGTIGQFAVSRAYANWGRSFMGALRQEMTENGVEPRQIYGFDRTGMKNAADIELVIDALDLAYLRTGISTFVLVSRDGGFAALARKLHELGKAVVVCADANCSKALQAVADVFIELPKPEEGLAPADDVPAQVSRADGARPAPDGQILDETRERVIKDVGELARRESERLAGEGIPLTIVGDWFAKSIPSLGAVRSGYPGLREFMQWALADTSFWIVSRLEGPQGAKPHLARRGHVPRGCEPLPDLERRSPRQFRDRAGLFRLLASQGEPYLRLANPGAIAHVLRQVATSGVDDEALATVTTRVADALAGLVTAEDVKFTLLSLAHSDVMSGEPPDAAVEERRYTLAPGAKTAGDLRTALLQTVRDKLVTRLGTVDDDALQGLVEATD